MRIGLFAALLIGCCPAEKELPAVPAARFDPAPYVYLLGYVQQPGRYQMLAPATVMQLVDGGGGFTPLAYKNGTTLIRIAEDGRKVRIRVPLEKILEREVPDIALYPGDIVFVPARDY